MRQRAGAALLGALLLVIGSAHQFAAAQPATVRLVIDYGDGVIKTFVDLPWTKGGTVLDVMNAAKARPHGITFSYSGSGGSAFLSQIDDVKNEGGGAGRKNWQFWVNTSYADRGFGAYEVQALDVVFWRFATPQVK
jgi:hypothetical protein